jgi:hypothetical protein
MLNIRGYGKFKIPLIEYRTGEEKPSTIAMCGGDKTGLRGWHCFTLLAMANKSRSRPKAIPAATRATVSFLLEVGIDMI